MDKKECLTALCQAEGVSGFEDGVAAVCQTMLEQICESVETDAFGNVAGLLPAARPDAPTLLLDAHMDQIGFVVTQVLPGGFLRFAPMGGVDPRMLLGCEVSILAGGGRYGVIACVPPHLQKKGEERNAVPMQDMVIDTGLLHAEEVISVGTPVVYRTTPCFLTEKVLTAKALDNRAGVAAVLWALSALRGKALPVHVQVLFSCQEETTALGARVRTYGTKPDHILAVDVSHAKTPDAPADKTFEFGKGVLIGMGPNLHTNFTQSLMDTAKKAGIPYQLEVMEGNTGTNAWEMQTVACGAATALLSIPLKYMHTQIETVAVRDIEWTAELICQAILAFGKEA